MAFRTIVINKASKISLDLNNIVIEDVSFNGEPLDGHMLERMIEEMEE